MKIIISGAGEVGSHLAKMLRNEANDICVIDSNQQRLTALSETADVVTVCGNPASIEVLKNAGAEKADLFVAVNPSTSQNVNVVCSALAKSLGSKKVVCRVNNEEYLAYDNKYLFSDMGIDLLFYPEKIAAGEIVDLLKRSASTEAMEFGRGKLQISVYKLEEDSPIIDKTLLDFSRDFADAETRFRVVAIARGNETIIPKIDTRFRYHDLVFIISRRDGNAPLMEYLGKKDIEIKSLMMVGGGPIAEMVAKQLGRQMESIKIIEEDKNRCLYLSEHLGDNVTIVNGDGRNTDLLIEESLRSTDAFVALTESSETNILTCVAAKKCGIARTIAEVENLEYIRLAEDMGVDAVINKKLITAGRIFKFTLSDKIRFIKYMSGTNAEVLEYITAPGSKITSAQLKDLDFPGDAVIGGLIRGNESIIAVGDTRIEDYDRVVVFALPQAVKEVDRFFR
ncbi:MAG: Trk system potassium transporter TrkA [Candidatus Cryptobacteroides sp.]|nr:Trk system potassium transporter TrkA [Bacteroidales bacterium]MDY2706634.1 Trk system potassium transporter TrkA [Candidatus Cryptobacteroides sp.]MCI6315165.1 Trk system potassium transporter TrkA [Bacteroidales bacterium]MCI7748879.1 Trk system potassium transporter TrkA [Bacteroidales bacterium]MDD6113971.1 Trk system potassium transporter TrkA [Bacteroidales bacterium]